MSETGTEWATPKDVERLLAEATAEMKRRSHIAGWEPSAAGPVIVIDDLHTSTPASPNGCRWCGVNEREHVQLWAEGRGWHGWEEPTPEQRRSRMLTRRAVTNP